MEVSWNMEGRVSWGGGGFWSPIREERGRLVARPLSTPPAGGAEARWAVACQSLASSRAETWAHD